MMDMVWDFANTVDSFADYLQFMFTEKPSKPVGGCVFIIDKVCLMMGGGQDCFIHLKLIFGKLII